MSDIKWIKIYINMLHNKKIKRIRKMPEGDTIVLIWIFILITAGESNKNGGLFLTKTIPFKEEDLAIEFDFDVETIKFALIALEKYEMVEHCEGVVYVKNWSEYQNIEGLDKVREQARVRMQKHRESVKVLRNSDVTVTQSDAIDIDIKNKNKIYIYSSLHVQLASLLMERIIENKPNFNRPSNIESWANEVRLMMEQDHRTYEQIASVINWCQSDLFWRSNILSVKKLREKFDQLESKMNTQLLQPIRKKTKTEESLEELERMAVEYDRCNSNQVNPNDHCQLPNGK